MMKLKLAALSLVFATVAQPAMAASCYQMWHARNSIFNEKGYCFKTTLGKQVFDNSDCWTKTPKLSKKEWKYVKLVRQEEINHGCVNGSG